MNFSVTYETVESRIRSEIEDGILKDALILMARIAAGVNAMQNRKRLTNTLRIMTAGAQTKLANTACRYGLDRVIGPV